MHKIKPAKVDDVGIILTMIRELAQWEGDSADVTANQELLTESLFGSASIAKVFIAYLADQPVGYMIYCPKFCAYTGRNEIYLQDLYLRKAVRGSGLGLAFMKRLAAIALKSNASRIEWFVDKNNTKAWSFYEKLGAQVIESIKIVRLDDDNLRILAD